MRSWLTAVLVVALLLYAGWVLDHQASQGGPVGAPSVEALERALAGAGGVLDEAYLWVAVRVTDPAAPTRMRAELLDLAGPVRATERRQIHLRTDKGLHHLEVQWLLTGPSSDAWAERYAQLDAALRRLGLTGTVHVELRGAVAGTQADLLRLARGGLDAVRAEGHEPWTGERSASIAGRSPLLPPSPHGINLQVAARQAPDQVRLFVGWPALNGNY